jgi:hypothetical protein
VLFSLQERRDTAALRQVGSGAAQQGVFLRKHCTASAAPFSLQERRDTALRQVGDLQRGRPLF